MDTKFSDRREYLLPDLSTTYKNNMSDIDCDEQIKRLLPLTEDLIALSPETQRKRRLAAQVLGICYSLAGDFLESQDESVLDDYNFI